MKDAKLLVKTIHISLKCKSARRSLLVRDASKRLKCKSAQKKMLVRGVG